MRALVIGGTSFIGAALKGALWQKNVEVIATTRETCDLLNLPDSLPPSDVVYICAAMTRFIDCEANPLAYRINVDAPLQIAEMCQPAKIVYLSSEAVERANNTRYGTYKALAELGLRTVCKPLIVRLSKVYPDRLGEFCEFLVGLSDRPPGIYHWP